MAVVARDVGSALCRNIHVHRGAAKYELDLETPREVAVGDLWSFFLALLKASDLALVEAEGLDIVVLAHEATRHAVPVLAPGEALPSESAFVTKLVVLPEGHGASDITNFLNLFKSTRGQVQPFQGSQLIVMSDYADNVRRLETILEAVLSAPRSKSAPPTSPRPSPEEKKKMADDIRERLGGD